MLPFLRPHPDAGHGAIGDLGRYRALGQVLADLTLDPLQRVGDRLAAAAQPPTDLLQGVLIQTQGQQARLELLNAMQATGARSSAEEIT